MEKIFIYGRYMASAFEGFKDEVKLFKTRDSAIKKLEEDLAAFKLGLQSYHDFSDEEMDETLKEWLISDIDVPNDSRYICYCDYDGEENIFTVYSREVND